MRRDLSDPAATPEPGHETLRLADEGHGDFHASQGDFDDRPQSPDSDWPAPADASDLLGEISEGLIHAYRFARQDGDPLTVALVEKALFHVGCRLARNMTPAEAGLVCH